MHHNNIRVDIVFGNITVLETTKTLPIFSFPLNTIQHSGLNITRTNTNGINIVLGFTVVR